MCFDVCGLVDLLFLNGSSGLFTVVLKAVGGEIGSASALAPKLGPLGLVSIPACIVIVVQCF